MRGFLFLHLLRTMRAALCFERNLREALRALLCGWVCRRLLARASEKRIHRHDDEEVDCGRDEHERNEDVDEIADHELAVVYREEDAGEVRDLGDGCDERREKILDERSHDRAERSADNHADSQVDDVPPKHKLFESLK